jgi:hypothetical protein
VKRKTKGTPKKKSSKKRNLGKYKSGLEKTCADLLAESGISFTYETHQYMLVDKFRYPGTYLKSTAKKKELTDRTNAVVLPIKYTPDFVGPDAVWIIETKGYVPSHHDFPMRWKLFLKHLIDSGEPVPALFICKNKSQIEQAIEKIKQLGYGRKGVNKRAARNHVSRGDSTAA